MRIGRLPGQRLSLVQGELQHVLVIFAQAVELRLELVLGFVDGGENALASSQRDDVAADLVLADFLILILCVNALLAFW